MEISTPLLIGFFGGFFMLAVLTLTAFVKISVVFMVVRNAMGLQQIPSNMIVMALALGAASDCDVQLLDDGVADQHATISFHTSIFGVLAEIKAHQPLLLGRQSLQEDRESGLVRLPVTLSIGGASLHIAGPQRAVHRIGRDDLAIGSLVAFVAVVVVLYANELVRAAQIDSVEAAVLRAPAPVAAMRADGLALAQQRLGQLGLASDVTVAEGESGSLLVGGQVPHARLPDWQSFLTWYDRKPGLPTLVSSVTVAPRLLELRPIQAVQLHAPATVFFVTGPTARVGDVLEQGWTLTGIDAEGLTLTRASETTRIRF